MDLIRFLTVLLLTLKGTDTTAVITVVPSSMSALLYTLVNFTCEGEGGALKWSVGGNSISDPSNQDREISVTTNNISVDVWSSVLTIRALPINDGVTVECTVLDQNLDFASEGATLTVEGTSPVQYLQLTFNETNSSLGWLTWSHPFKNYPISYHIYIENQHGQLLYNDITNDTFYELYNLTVCDIYTATVIAHNGEYSSNNATIQEEFSGEYYVTVLPDHKVIFNEHNSCNVQFRVIVLSHFTLCNSTLRAITRDISQLDETEMELDISCSSENCQSETVNYTTPNIGPQRRYIFCPSVVDSLKKSKAKNESNFTTYHVQGLALQYYSNDGSVVVECRFAERSTADGCHVIFRELSKRTVKSINMNKSSIEESTVSQYISLPVSGNYTVTAHDIVDGTIITNSSVVYPQVLEYILPSIDGTSTIDSKDETTGTASIKESVFLITNNTSTTDSKDETIGTASIKESVSLITNNTSTTDIMTSTEPTSGPYNVSQIIWIFAIVVSVVIVLLIPLIMKFKCLFALRKKKSNKERVIVNSSQPICYISYDDATQSTTTVLVNIDESFVNSTTSTHIEYDSSLASNEDTSIATTPSNITVVIVPATSNNCDHVNSCGTNIKETSFSEYSQQQIISESMEEPTMIIPTTIVNAPPTTDVPAQHSDVGEHPIMRTNTSASLEACHSSSNENDTKSITSVTTPTDNELISSETLYVEPEQSHYPHQVKESLLVCESHTSDSILSIYEDVNNSEMVTTTSSVSWPPSTSMEYVSEHTESDNINKKSEQFEPGINSYANEFKRKQGTTSTARPELAESSNVIPSDMVTDDVLSPRDVLPLPLNTSALDDKQPKDPIPDTSGFNMKEESFIEPHIELNNTDTIVSETTF